LNFFLYIFHLHDFSYTARDNRANIAVIAVNRAIIAAKPKPPSFEFKFLDAIFVQF
jgi:hypothetical protein